MSMYTEFMQINQIIEIKQAFCSKLLQLRRKSFESQTLNELYVLNQIISILKSYWQNVYFLQSRIFCLIEFVFEMDPKICAKNSKHLNVQQAFCELIWKCCAITLNIFK